MFLKFSPNLHTVLHREKAEMGLRTLPLSSASQNGLFQRSVAPPPQTMLRQTHGGSYRLRVVSAKKEEMSSTDDQGAKNKQSLFTRVTDALDFAQVRSVEDAQLLEDARQATKSGGRMSREQVVTPHLRFSSKPIYHTFGSKTI